jgi:hypothetical protein
MMVNQDSQTNFPKSDLLTPQTLTVSPLKMKVMEIEIKQKYNFSISTESINNNQKVKDTQTNKYSSSRASISKMNRDKLV